jgi:TolB-like protein/class 3 adenylate cyclase/tetratricopeptide (TPR) repeat protein
VVSERVERRLSAILAADVTGYSRLMGLDEEGTLAQLKAHRHALIDPKIAEHRGRIVKTTGDGMLVEFASVVDAVRCAVDVQQGMIERNGEVPQDKQIQFRIGVNVGDIIIEGGDIFGDGVNVAARLEGIAEPGGICVSSRVLEDIRGKINIDFEDLGEQQLKNIVRPIRVYRAWLREDLPAPMPTLALPDKPSIAVLPFQNMSGDPEQEYFADGVVEDIITALSRFRNLFVIARNSSFVYKGRAVDIKQVGRELGVRYVLEGSVRKAAKRVRIAGQLINASDSTHLWADRLDGALEDVFDLQDRVTESVVGAIGPKLLQAEIERAKRKPTAHLDAYDCYLRALACTRLLTDQSIAQALPLLYKAIELDPDYAAVFGLAAICYHWRKANGWMTDPAQESIETARLARKAAALGKDDALALSLAGQSLAFLEGNLEEGASLIDRALALNPNLADAWLCSSWVTSFRGDPDTALVHVARAMRLSPLDPLIGGMQAASAFAYFLAYRYDEASIWAEKAMREQPHVVTPLRVAAASYALSGRMEQANKVMVQLRQIDPTLRMSNVKDRIPPLRQNDLTRYVEALRAAGLPD